MSEQNAFIDASDLHKYRIELPNMVDDMNLTPYAFRLYSHIKRVAGAKDGHCNQSTETMAEICNMSTGMVSKAKQELKDAGLILIEVKATDRNIYHYITIVDIWPQNFAKYSHSSSPSEPGSPDEKLHSQGEKLHSPGEGKKEPVKKEPFKKQPPGADAPPKTPEKPKECLALNATPGGARLMFWINQEQAAQGHREARNFPTVACRNKWLKECEGRLNGNLDKAITTALEQGIKGVVSVVNYVAKYGTVPQRSYGKPNQPPEPPVPTEAERAAAAAAKRAQIRAAKEKKANGQANQPPA